MTPRPRPASGGAARSIVAPHVTPAMSQTGAMVECVLCWGKRHGTNRETKRRGIARIAADFLVNLIHIPKLVIP